MKFISIVLFLVGAFSFGQRSDFDSISFNKADSIALEHKGASLKNLPVLVHNLTSDLPTEVEKFRSIYTWVCTNIENDYGSYQKTVKKRKKLSDKPEALTEWNDGYTPKVFEKLVTHRKTACTGYAFLIREMAKMADIKCKIVNGYGRTPTLILNENSIPNHSWNSVELNNKWYLCDPTWSAGRIILEDGIPRFEADYFDGYFLADPSLFVKNHYPLEKDWTLVSNNPEFQNFLDGPVVYKGAFKQNVLPIAPREMHLEIVKNESVSFSLNTSEIFENESLSLVLNKVYDIQPIVTRNQENYILQHSFEKSGSYDVHIKVEDIVIATYVVKVNRK